MNRNQLVFLTICILGLILVFNIFGLNSSSTDNMENAPPLKKLLIDHAKGPHQEFKGIKECLVCHEKSIKIPSFGTTPMIPHEIRPDCTTCHTLPEK